jgi:pyridoxal phosphate enzyme (YggS family)
VSVAERLAALRARIESAGADPDAIVVIAVTKGFDASAVGAAVAAGLLDLGENYAQELLAKAEAAPDGVRWHAIGRLQRNKVRSLAPHVALWQSVDRAELGGEIARRAPGAAVLVQVNVSDEPQKGGCEPGETAALVHDLRADGLQVEGLMAVGPTGPPEAGRPAFARLRALADELALPVRSMGMTADLEVAVAEGATMVRIGTALFGPRSPKRATH